ncbi:MAG: uroporphyrinogen decarboxylase family protein [Syntrophaceticus sp.]
MTMTPIQRAEALKEGRRVDRMPCAPMIAEYAACFAGVDLRDYLHSAELIADCHIKCYRHFGYDSIGISPMAALAEAMGGTLTYAPDTPPSVLKHPLSSWDDLGKLRLPDPLKDGRLPLYFEAMERIRDAVGHEVKVGSGIGGPMSVASLVIGTENLLMAMIKQPDQVHQLLQFSTDIIISYMEICAQRGFGCSMGDGLLSKSLISTRLFRQFVRPYLQHIADWYRDRWGKSPSMHICGDTKNIWHDMAEIGFGRLSIDDMMSLAEAKRIVGHVSSLKGNVSPTRVLLLGTPEEAREASCRCLDEAADNPKGFMLSTGCNLAWGTPPENIQAMLDAARIWYKENREV